MEEEHPYKIEAVPGTKPARHRYNQALPPSTHTILACGLSGGGKTNACLCLYGNKKFPFRAQFKNGQNIWLVSPTHAVQKAKWDYLNIPEEQRFRQYDEDVLGRFIKAAENDGQQPPQPRLIILDDCIASLPLSRQSHLIDILIYGRHLNCSAFCAIQKWSCSLSHISKSNFTQFWIFPQNYVDQKGIFECCCQNIPKKLFSKMCNDSWNEDWGFLNIDRTLPRGDGRYGCCLTKKYSLKINNEIEDESYSTIVRTGQASKEERGRETQKVRRKLRPKHQQGYETDYERRYQSRVLRE